ncbi:MAG: hemagglutinin repeat-containing protein [Elusimicrobiota bacterium]|jgi:hypothetical protein|nr:hemagglutinin repeat-containing protein [Elusimicrobiota bacterium]
MRNTEKSSWFGLEGSKDKVYDEIHTLEAASVFAGKDLNLTSGKDATILASDIGAQGNGNIETGGNFNLLAGIESSLHEEYHYEKGFGGFDISFDRGRLSAGINYDLDTKTTQEYTESARGSSLNFGNNLNIDSMGNVTIKGSDLGAQGDITLTADEVYILAQEQISKYKEENEHQDVRASVGVGNAYVDAGFAVAALVKAVEAADDAKDKLSHMKDLYDEGKASKGAVDDAKAGLALATASLAQATLAVAQAAAQAAAAATSGLGTGMYANVAVDANVSKDIFTNDTVLNHGSLLGAGGNISINSRGDSTQVGSIVGAEGDISYNVGGDLNLLASEDSGKNRFSSESYSAGVSMGSNGGSISMGYNESNSVANWTTHNNSATQAGGVINYNVGNNMLGQGYNAKAADINVDVGGTLSLESLQDTYYARGNQIGVSAGVGFGSSTGGNKFGMPDSVSGGNVGFNTGSDYTDMAWVNNQTGLIANNSVNINADKIDLTGASIANITEDGTDGNNLNITTNSLTYEDIKDINNNESSGYGVNIGVNTSNTGAVGGTSSLTLKSDGSEKEQSTRSTIGQGNIIIGGQEQGEDSELLTGLNRDISQTQELTKEQITGALDASLTIDNRMLSSAGLESIAYDTKNFADNVLTAGAGVIDGTKNLGKTTYVAADTILDGGGIGEVNDKINIMQMEREFALVTNDIKETMQGKSEEEVLTALNNAKTEIAKKYGVADKDYQSLLANSTDSRYGSQKDNIGVVNLDKVKTDELYANVSTHEMVHASGGDEVYAGKLGDFAQDVSGGALTIMNTGSMMEEGTFDAGSSIFNQGNAWLVDNPQDTTQNMTDAMANRWGNSVMQMSESEQRFGAMIGGGLLLSTIPGGQYLLGMLGGYEGTQSLAENLGTIVGQEANEYGAYAVPDGNGGLNYIHKDEMYWNVAGNTALTGFSLLPLMPRVNVAKGVSTVDSLPNQYQEVKEASKYLQDLGISRLDRVKILQSFNPQNMSVNVAGDATYALRYYDIFDAKPNGPFLFPTFTNQSTRSGMAILSDWNKMTNIQQFQLRPGSVYIQGTAAPQGFYPGGSQQIFTFPSNLVKP